MEFKATSSASSGREKTVTQRDIAEQVAVDIGTVSRALAGDRGVSKDRGEQIRAYARAMGYRPKPLRRKRTDAIGLVMRAIDSTSPNLGYLERMLYLAEVGAVNHGKHLHIHMFRSDTDTGPWPKFISENRVDGVLVLGHGPQSFYDRLRQDPIPAAAINDTAARTGVDCVLCDPTPGMSQAIERLLTLGHRSIGLVITLLQYPTIKKRYDAYMAAMRKAGIEPDPRWIVQEVPLGLRGGQQAIRTYISSGLVPSAILFNDDWIAMGGVYELARQGLLVPDDVSVVGYDNTAISEESSPSLTSVDNHEQQLMNRAMEMLQQRIDGFSEPPREEFLNSRLVWRESCASFVDRSHASGTSEAK